MNEMYRVSVVNHSEHCQEMVSYHRSRKACDKAYRSAKSRLGEKSEATMSIDDFGYEGWLTLRSFGWDIFEERVREFDASDPVGSDA